jgi:ABC-type amino acid transport substrate-binding protein
MRRRGFHARRFYFAPSCGYCRGHPCGRHISCESRSRCPSSYKMEQSTPYQFPKTALGVSETCFFRRVSDQWEYKSPQSLASQTMGWINDYLFGDNTGLNDWVTAHKGTSQLLTVSGTVTHPRLFKLLLTQRISTFAEDRYVISYKLKKLGLQDKIAVAGCTGPIDKVCVAFSQKTGRGEMLAKALDDGVEKLRRNGRLAAILKTYGLNEDSWVPQ